jgi:hypothetical protein
MKATTIIRGEWGPGGVCAWLQSCAAAAARSGVDYADFVDRVRNLLAPPAAAAAAAAQTPTGGGRLAPRPSWSI